MPNDSYGYLTHLNFVRLSDYWKFRKKVYNIDPSKDHFLRKIINGEVISSMNVSVTKNKIKIKSHKLLLSTELRLSVKQQKIKKNII